MSAHIKGAFFLWESHWLYCGSFWANETFVGLDCAFVKAWIVDMLEAHYTCHVDFKVISIILSQSGQY